MVQQLLLDEQNQPQWLSAQYRDVVMSKFGQGRIGVIGDAAHAMSPQLGQGANMALLDAWAFSQSLRLLRRISKLTGRYYGNTITNSAAPRLSSISFSVVY
jgi:2-polyprenyl-6-methoxyphenol hydroxylase-like FAD-dependent oxidoreductase